MKTRSKAFLLALCAVLLVMSTVFGTLAYLTDTEKATNTFTVGKVDIKLDEAEVNEDGTVVEGADRVQENTYHLLPGHTYVKDPTVHVMANSEKMYLFVKVENGIANIESKRDGYTKVADQIVNTNGWNKLNVDGLADNTSVYYKTVDKNATQQDFTVFSTFEIDGAVTNADLDKYEGETIVVTAYAVQYDGMDEKSVEDIWKIAQDAKAYTAPAATPDPVPESGGGSTT